MNLPKLSSTLTRLEITAVVGGYCCFCEEHGYVGRTSNRESCEIICTALYKDTFVDAPQPKERPEIRSATFSGSLY